MTYRIVSLPINPISKIPQSSYYTKKSQVAAFLSCLSARQLDMMELLNALALAEGRGVRALSSRCSLVPGRSLPSPSAPLHCCKSPSTFSASPRAVWRGRQCCCWGSDILCKSSSHRASSPVPSSPAPWCAPGQAEGADWHQSLVLGLFSCQHLPTAGSCGSGASLQGENGRVNIKILWECVLMEGAGFLLISL